MPLTDCSSCVPLLRVQLLALYSERSGGEGADEWDDVEKDKRMAGVLEELRLLIINLNS